MPPCADNDDDLETRSFLGSEKLSTNPSSRSWWWLWSTQGISAVKFFILALLFVTSVAFVVLAIQNLSLLTTNPKGMLRLAQEKDVLNGNPHNHIPMIQPCGNTTRQAKAAGCHFDIITFGWFPTRCYDAELANKFDKLQTWRWYRSADGKDEVPREEALSGINPLLYISWEYHLIHCTYLWRKMHRAIVGPHGLAALDSYTGKLHHTEHCGDILVSRRDIALETINTRIYVKYPDCGVFEGVSGYDHGGQNEGYHRHG